MNDKRKMLLFKALKQGRISIKEANRLYSGNSGRDALMSLEYQGYLEHEGWGNFRPNEDARFPEEVVDRYRRWKKSQEGDS